MLMVIVEPLSLLVGEKGGDDGTLVYGAQREGLEAEEGGSGGKTAGHRID